MRIGLNYFNINPAYRGGINTYTLGLTEGFAAVNKTHQFNIFVKEKAVSMFEKFTNTSNIKIIPVKDISSLKYNLRKGSIVFASKGIYRSVCNSFYKEVCEIINANSDLVYTPTTILFPYMISKPTVISMHDVQQFHYPEFFSKAELLSRKIHFGLSADMVTHIQASSRFIKQDLLQHFTVLKPEQITVIPEGVDIDLFAKEKETKYLNDKYNLPKEFLFFPAQLWLHKNHITVLKAIKQIELTQNKKIPLVLTGAKESAAKQIFSFVEENKMDYVHYLGVVPFEDILALYKRAKFLITGVLYESSSLPVLEAAASGTAVIASATPPNKELNEILNINLFQPTNVDELVYLLLKIWDDNTLIKKQVSHNLEHIEHYSWNNVASRYIELFERLVK